MTYKDAVKILRDAGVPDAEYDARELFLHFGAVRPQDIYMGDVDVNSEELTSAVARRAAREPLQYITGSVGFYREEYVVSNACLIPRADTECLVDYAVKHIPPGERFIDISTGSGCIAISTLKNTKDTTATALDISDAALDLARQNAEKNCVSERIEFVHADILSSAEEISGEYFALLSNPPYVTNEEYEGLSPEVYKEPKIAFVGGEDGGDFYRVLVPLGKRIVKRGGFIAFEIGYRQRGLLESLAKEHGLRLDVIRDLSGNDRVAVMKID